MNDKIARGNLRYKYLLLTLLLLATTGCKALEQKILYNPAPYPKKWTQPTSCETRGLCFEEAHFVSCDGMKLHGWFVQPACTQPSNVLLFSHGRSGNVSTMKSHLFKFVRRHQVAVLIFDYRGFGKSEGRRPDETGLYRDATAARDWLAQRTGVERSEVILMGRSLGVSVAVDVAARDGAKALILENGFTSLPDIVRHHTHDLMSGRRVFDACFNSKCKLAQFTGPVFISHGKKDRAIPFSIGVQLAESATAASRVEFHANEGGHRSLPTDAYRQSLDDFLKSL
jgi:pimeloyl-ACP methyl ester carboxylesterase